MMIFITIVFLIATTVTIVVYFKKTNLDQRYSFSSLSTLLQTIFVFITLWITIFTIRSSSSDSEQLFGNLKSFNTKLSKMDTSLNRVSDKLAKLPKQLEDFSESIKSLNNVQTKQSEDFKKNTILLNETIISLHSTVKDYENNIVNYSHQLEPIVKQTDQQLNIWKDQQRIMLDEMSRKPVLSLAPKIFNQKNDTLTITDIDIINNGNIESFNRALYLIIPSSIIDSISSSSFKYYQQIDGNNIYRFLPMDTNADIISAGSKIIIPIYLRVISKSLTNIIYRIDYYSRYDSGIKSDDMKLIK